MSGKGVVLALDADSFFLRGYYARGGVRDYKLSGIVIEGILAALGAGYGGKACPRAHLLAPCAYRPWALDGTSSERVFGTQAAKRLSRRK